MTGVNGGFSVSLPLPADAQFVVEAPRAPDAQGRGICGGVKVTRDVPGDADGVDGGLDQCPDVDGSATNPVPGCPTLTRTVTASYADAEVTGLVSSPDRPDACADEVTLEAASWAPDGTKQPLVRFSSEVNGTYRLGADGVPGTRYQITAVRRAGPHRAGTVC